MLRSAGDIKIDQLTHSKFHIWKPKIDLILIHRKPDEVISQQEPWEKVNVVHSAWVKRDKCARATVGFSRSNETRQHVCSVNTAKRMLDLVYNVFQQYTRLNNQRACRYFRTVEMRDGERRISYITRMQHLGSILNSMRFDIDNKKLAVTTLNGLLASMNSSSQTWMSLSTTVLCLLRKPSRGDCSKKSRGEICVSTVIKLFPHFSKALLTCKMFR